MTYFSSLRNMCRQKVKYWNVQRRKLQIGENGNKSKDDDLLDNKNDKNDDNKNEDDKIPDRPGEGGELEDTDTAIGEK